MPRQARIVVAGELFHVTQRGNYKQKIFENNGDRAYYLKLFEKYKIKYGLEVLAFCLMDNHVHWIVRPQRMDSMAQTLSRCHQRYSSYRHTKKNVLGHLWQERFYSCLLQGEHIRQAIRYVERNPVRAGLVEHPWDYTWSSAKAHLGKAYKAITLSNSSEYLEGVNWKEFISQTEEERQIKEIREKTMKGSVLGSEEFIKNLEISLNRKILSKPKGRPKNSNKW